MLQPRPPLIYPMRGSVSDAYVAAAVRGETDRVARAVVGTRNTTLFTAAARLGRFVAAGDLAEADAVTALRCACEGFKNFRMYEADRTIRSSLSRAAQRGGTFGQSDPPATTR